MRLHDSFVLHLCPPPAMGLLPGLRELYGLWGTHVSRGAVIRDVQRRLHGVPGEQDTFYHADFERRLVAALDVTGSRAGRKVSALHRLYVAPPFRRRGVGTQLLLQAVIDTSVLGGEILLAAVPRNTPAYRWLRNLRFPTYPDIVFVELPDPDTPEDEALNRPDPFAGLTPPGGGHAGSSHHAQGYDPGYGGGYDTGSSEWPGEGSDGSAPADAGTSETEYAAEGWGEVASGSSEVTDGSSAEPVGSVAPASPSPANSAASTEAGTPASSAAEVARVVGSVVDAATAVADEVASGAAPSPASVERESPLAAGDEPAPLTGGGGSPVTAGDDVAAAAAVTGVVAAVAAPPARVDDPESLAGGSGSPPATDGPDAPAPHPDDSPAAPHAEPPPETYYGDDHYGDHYGSDHSGYHDGDHYGGWSTVKPALPEPTRHDGVALFGALFGRSSLKEFALNHYTVNQQTRMRPVRSCDWAGLMLLANWPFRRRGLHLHVPVARIDAVDEELMLFLERVETGTACGVVLEGDGAICGLAAASRPPAKSDPKPPFPGRRAKFPLLPGPAVVELFMHPDFAGSHAGAMLAELGKLRSLAGCTAFVEPAAAGAPAVTQAFVAAGFRDDGPCPEPWSRAGTAPVDVRRWTCPG